MRPLNISELKFEDLIDHEWLIANGVGGYASSSMCGLNTRKYHGLLVAAMSPPLGRMVLLSHVEETVIGPRGTAALSCNEYPDTIHPHGHELLRAFNVDPFPRWGFQGADFTIEKWLRVLPGRNAVCLSYSLLGGDKSVELEIRPLLAMRPIHELMYQWNALLAAQEPAPGQARIPASARTPEVFFAHDGKFQSEPYWYLNTIYRREQERGYAGLEDLWSPGIFRWTLSPGQAVHLVCSADPVELEAVRAELASAQAASTANSAIIDSPPAGLGQDDENLQALIRASGAFVVSGLPTSGRSGRPVNVMSSYHWGTANGRSALVGFAGLFLVPRRFEQARALLENLASFQRDGLMPTDFAEDGSGPKYNGADTALWFIAALGDYLTCTGDQKTAKDLLATAQNILETYRKGTGLGIACDADGLVGSQSTACATSWMDAQLGDWIVTPRSGQTVELNALWYNALRVVSDLQRGYGKAATADAWFALAKNVRAAFNRRFWNKDAQCCFDVLDQDRADASIRPNQVLALSLAHPVLAPEYHAMMLQTVIGELLTPMGLRTLSNRDSAYKGRYGGGVASRDISQHQGSAYPWLLGQLGCAFLRVHGRETASLTTVRRWLEPCLSYLQGDGLGTLCELFDGDSPQKPGGAVASAISVAEILRCYARDVLGLRPVARPMPAPLRVPPGGVKPAGAVPPT